MSNEKSQALLVGPREAARLLDISERHLWALTKHRRIPSIKLGRLVKYAVADLAAFIERSKSPTASAA